jgi:hypothetical protein
MPSFLELLGKAVGGLAGTLVNVLTGGGGRETRQEPARRPSAPRAPQRPTSTRERPQRPATPRRERSDRPAAAPKRTPTPQPAPPPPPRPPAAPPAAPPEPVEIDREDDDEDDDYDLDTAREDLGGQSLWQLLMELGEDDILTLECEFDDLHGYGEDIYG